MKTLVISIFIFLPAIYFSQTQGIAYTAVGKGVATTFLTDYHCLGVNTSSLGWGTGFEKKRFTIGSSESSVGIYSDSLNVDRLRKLYKAIRKDISGNEDTSSDWQQQREYAADYANAGLTMDASFNWFGFSFQTEKLGGIAFSIQEQYNWFSQLNQETTELLFEGKFAQYFDSLTIAFGNDTSRISNYQGIAQDTLNAVVLGTISNPLQLSQITAGSELRMSWNRHYNFGYGRKLFGNDSTFALYGGVGGRFIQSMAMLTLRSDGENIYMYSSMSPFYDINYGAITNMNDIIQSGTLPNVVGNGYGIDLSASARLFGKLKLGAAVNNIGSVTYTRNVYRVRDSILGDMRLNGLNNYNVTNATNLFLEDGGILSLESQEKYTVKNPATVRFGASLDLDIAELGIDVIAPFNSENPGSILNPVYSIGGELKPIKWLRISTGYFGGGIYKHNIPVGINFLLGDGACEFGISSRDMLSFFLDESSSVSTAFGFARFRF